MEKILVATNNKGKLKELKEILNNYELLSLKDINLTIDVDEDGNSFEENSKEKAKTVSEIAKMPCIADDSGLCIDVLDGWPGIYTSRFLGDNATDRQRNENILEKMKDINIENRKAKVVCVVTYYSNGKYIIAKGELEGRISENIRGNNGFGFDEIFELEDGRTLAELSDLEKNQISARKIALQILQEKLSKI